MIDFLYFAYYRLHQWAEKREQNFPIILVLTWLTVISVFHAGTILSLITIIWGIDSSIKIPEETFGKILWIACWSSLLWIVIKIGKIKEKAFRPTRVTNYEKKGFKTWWLIVYLISSFAAMACSTWVAGSVLRSQG